MVRLEILVVVLALVAVTAVSSASIVFEDSKSDIGRNNHNIDSRARRIDQTSTGQSLEEEDRHHHHNRRKNKKVICGIAHLITKRETGEGDRTRRETTEQGRGLGVAGFLLGAFVGSKYQQHQYQYQNQPHPPPPPQQQQQQQGVNNEDYDQVEDQGGGGGLGNHGGGGLGNHGGGGGSICNSLQQQNAQQYIGGIGSGSHFPILASLLTNGGGGGSGGNKIGQLPQSQNLVQPSQFQRPGPVQFSQNLVQQSQFQRPGLIQFSQNQRPAPISEPQFQRPDPVQFRPQPQRPVVQQQQQNGFVNTYVRPWVDLFLK